MAVDLSIIIVTWNVSTLLRRCLDSLGAARAPLCVDGYSAEITVVDNASRDDTVAMVQGAFPLVRLIASPTNLGFSRANNLALAGAQGRHVLLLNPDTEVTPGAVGALVRYLDAEPRVAVVGPRLLYGDGTPQSSRRRFPTLLTGLFESTPLEAWFPHNPWARAYRLEDVPDDAPQRVDWLNGSCLAVRRAAIAQVGPLDEGFFMYSEEVDWCRRLRSAGWEVAYLPEAVVTHHEGRSSAQVHAARQIYFDSSKVRYLRKHHGVLQAEALRAGLLGMHLLRFVEETAKFAFGHKRSLRRARMHAYARVLASGLRAPGSALDG